jgi:hypothetical protein
MPTRDKVPAALDELGKALERFTKQSDRNTALIIAAWLDDSLADFLAELAAIQRCTWPLRAAPVLRREGTLTCIDLVAASECLESLLQASIGDGRIPNIRAQHFELLTQDPINQSSWKPTAEVEKLCGRTVRVRGEAHMDKLFVAPIVALRITAGMVILKVSRTNVDIAAKTVGGLRRSSSRDRVLNHLAGRYSIHELKRFPCAHAR